MSTNQEIAIIGMACRFPGEATSPEGYWDLLCQGIDATTDLPADRWSAERFHHADPSVPGKAYVRRGGYLKESIEGFDARFFGISPREATPMDPQQRLLLEVTWEAFERAGLVPKEIRGSKTGVYVGGFTIDNKLHLLNSQNREAISAHTTMGATLVMLSNRISHTFDLRGPSLTVDTACSSSLVALHLACQSLRLGECEMALAGGVNVMFRPEYTIAMCKGGFLAPDGRCKAFDASGDGYGRGEGAGLVILKPLATALRDGDPIHAVVVETGVNQDGRTDGITLPDGNAQRALIDDVCVRAGVEADQIQYVEAHGTGTRAGDTTEATSLGESLAKRRSGDSKLLVGSAKSNLGHLEAAAGVAGVIKTALALEHRQIPPSLHFEQPPPGLDFEDLRLEIPTSLRDWPETSGPAMASVNSFGYGGTNAHVLLAESPERPPRPAEEPQRPVVVPLSARSEKALAQRLETLLETLITDPQIGLADLGYTLARRRSHHDHRAALVASTTNELTERLERALAKDDPSKEPASDPGFCAPRKAAREPKLAFVYTGMGPQFWGMGMDLLAGDAVARRIFERCEAIWQRLAGWSLSELFSARTGAPMMDPQHAQPGNFVVQMMLTEVLASYGVQPRGMIGHSAGEVAAACASGSLNLEDGLVVTWHRSRLQQQKVGEGRMLAVGLGPEEVQVFLEPFAGQVALAAVNSPSSVTLAGEIEALKAVSERLEAASIFHRLLKVEVAYHSHQMDALGEALRANLAPLAPHTPSSALYSTVTGTRIAGAEQDAAYWWRNTRQPALFREGLLTLLEDGFDTFLELGPHPVLSAAIKDCLRFAKGEGEVYPTLHRERKDAETVTGCVARLHTRGIDLDWPKQYPSGRLVQLPAYPWDREKLWTESADSRTDRLGGREHPMLWRRPSEALPAWDGELSAALHPYLKDHQVERQAIFPAAGFIELALAASKAGAGSVAIEGFSFQQALAIDETPLLRFHLDRDGSSFSIHSRRREPDASWNLNTTGRLLRAAVSPRSRALDGEAIRSRCGEAFDPLAFYETVSRLGLHYGPGFRCLREGFLGAGEILTRIAVPEDERSAVSDYFVHPALLDAALQSLLAAQIHHHPARQQIYVPISIAQVRFHTKPGADIWCHGTFPSTTSPADGGILTGDLVLFNREGEVAVEIFGLRAQAIHALPVAKDAGHDDLLYRTRWDGCRGADPDIHHATRWLTFADRHGVAAELFAQAEALRMTHVLVRPGEPIGMAGDEGSGDGRAGLEGALEISRGDRTEMERLVRKASEQPIDGIVYLWGLDLPDGADDGEARETAGIADVADLIHAVQCTRAAVPGRELTLVVATVGARRITASDRVAGPGQHALLGAVRALAAELPDLRVKLVDLGTRLASPAAKALATEILRDDDEPEVAFRSGSRYVRRLVRWDREDRCPPRPSTSNTRFELRELSRSSGEPGGGPRGWTEIERVVPGPGQVEVALHTCAFAESSLDLNGVGRIVAIGKATSFRIGEDVVLLTPLRRLASHATVAESLVASRTEVCGSDGALDLVDWALAHQVLFGIAGLQGGECILIHDATRGIGPAALELARRSGARVFATAATDAQRQHLRSIGIEFVSDARTLRFVDDLLAWTEGRGIDVVLSPLGGDLRAAGLEVVAPGGRFLDISAQPRNESILLPPRAFETGLRYLRADLSCLRQQADTLRHALRSFLDFQGSDPAAPLPARIFRAADINGALRALELDEQVGKVAVRLEGKVPIHEPLPRPLVRSDGGYLVTGGFGGLGLATVKWLAAGGARHIGVVSRSGPCSQEARDTIHRLRQEGVEVVSIEADLADAQEAAGALRRLGSELPRLRGVVYAAGVLSDAAFEALDTAHIEQVMGPKALGALHLHRELAATELDFFVCYGSIAATLGNAGQVSYAAANAFLDGLTTWRRANGLSGTCLSLGPIADIGMAARDERIIERLAKLGLEALPPAQVFGVLEEALSKSWASLDAFRVDWATWRARNGVRRRKDLSEVMTASQAETGDPVTTFRRRILAAKPEDRHPLVFSAVARMVSDVLQVHVSRLDTSTSLRELGIDSLMASELVAVLRERTGAWLPILDLTRGPRLTEVSERVAHHVLAPT